MSSLNRTDTLLYKIKNNKVIASIIVLAVITTAVITFWEKVEPSYNKIVKRLDPPEAYTSFDYIKEQFNTDTLKAKRRLKGMVARRDYGMYFIIPTGWDIDEPIDGPAGLRYQTYSLPENPACMISASAEITCFKDLINPNDTVFHESEAKQQSDFKKLSGFEESDKDGGYCSLDGIVEKRIAEAKKGQKKFKLYYVSPAHRTFQKANGETYPVETKRFKYSFEYQGTRFYVLNIICYMHDITFKLEFGAPEADYLKQEAAFIDISNNMYFAPMTD